MSVEALFIGPTEFRAGDFDARKRYLRAGNTLSNFPIVRGATVSFSLVQLGSPNTYNAVSLRYSVAGHVQQPTLLPAGTFNADYTLVTT